MNKNNGTLIAHADPAPSAVRFVAIADFSYRTDRRATQDIAEQIDRWGADFIITMGDNNYPKGEAETIDRNIGQMYQQYIHPYRGAYGAGADHNRFFPALGNHDYFTPRAWPYLAYFSHLPGNGRYYDFVWGPCHFFAINSNSEEPDGNSADSIQANWLRTQLQNSTAPWKIVYFHSPPYVSNDLHGAAEEMRWPFAEWGADLILNGHIHVYERFEVDGIPYIVSGMGGHSIYSFPSWTAEHCVFRYNEEFGSLFFEADENHCDVKFMTRYDEVIDQICLTKGSQLTSSSLFYGIRGTELRQLAISG